MSSSARRPSCSRPRTAPVLTVQPNRIFIIAGRRLRHTIMSTSEQDCVASRPTPPDLAAFSTRRLRLRELTPADVPRLAKISNSKTLAEMMVNVPYPYSEQDAKRLVAGGVQVNRSGRGLMAGAIRRATSTLLGVGAVVLMDPDTATVSYWLGETFWGNGYGSEFVIALAKFGFVSLNARGITVKN